MKNQIVLFCQCIFGPSLYQTYPLLPIPHNQLSDHRYRKNIIEILSGQVFLFLRISIQILRIIWPLCLLYFYRQGTSIYETGISLLGLVICFTTISMYFMLLRGISRLINPSYRTFAQELLKVKKNTTKEVRQKFLSKFDFSLSHWKPDYRIHSSAVRKLPIITISKDSLINQTKAKFIERVFHYPTLLLGYICVNLFGYRLMFPGSLQIFYQMVYLELLDGRMNLIVINRAKRFLLRTADGNHIDTMFVDRRSSKSGQMLVITCEGNAGFYETGSMMAATRTDYSVLGWNRPGFGESSGYPGVLSEINSIDAVMHYAINELHFPVNHIIIFAWSIGGYSACWTAVHYQDIHGLILDAIFDDVLPLAQRQMPSFTSKFVEKTIRYYLNLNNIEFLKLYNGPFYLIRRLQDEVMNMTNGKVETNRANEILYSILPYRYPLIYNNEEILSLFKEYICCDKFHRKILFDTYCSDNIDGQIDRYRFENPIVAYPCNFGENFSINERKCFALYLVNQYLVNFDSNHCTSLPRIYFYIPDRCI